MKDQRVSSRTWLLLALAFTGLMIFYAQFILGYFSSDFAVESGENSLGLLMNYSWQDVISFLNARSLDQLHSYIYFLRIWDTIFPIIYTLMYASWILYLFHRWRWVLVLPILRMCIDWAENYFEISMVQEYMKNGVISNEVVELASFTTQFKWGLSFALYFLLLLGIVIKIRHSRNRNNEAISQNGK